MESPQPKRVRKVENSPPPADVKKDLLTASKTLEEIGQLIKDQQVELMASLRSLSAHHEEILQDHNEYWRKLAYHKERYQSLSFLCSVTDYMILSLIAATNYGLILPPAKTEEILQDLTEYRRKLAYDMERYQSLSFLCSVTDYMILSLIATNHGVIRPAQKMTIIHQEGEELLKSLSY